MPSTTELLSRLGSNKIAGSSMTIGLPYQDIPELGMAGHRNNSQWRAKRALELVDMKGREVYDLGCSVGTMSRVFAGLARRVVGIDYDEASIDVAQSISAPNLEFRCADLTHEFLDKMEHTDIVVWTSQFMWMVKQRGMDYALDFLWKLSTKCDVLIFETAGQDDGSAPLDMKQEEFFAMLCQNTVFQDITDHGPWNDGWTPRNVFVCKQPFSKHEGEWSSVEPISRGRVRKTFYDHPFAKELKEREAEALWVLGRNEGGFRFPKILAETENNIEINYCGMRAKWIPELDVELIVDSLKYSDIVHRDIRPENVLWNGSKIVLIDFSFSTIGKEITNYHYDLGGKYKCPYGFNDEYSLRKVQHELMEKSG